VTPIGPRTSALIVNTN